MCLGWGVRKISQKIISLIIFFLENNNEYEGRHADGSL